MDGNVCPVEYIQNNDTKKILIRTSLGTGMESKLRGKYYRQEKTWNDNGTCTAYSRLDKDIQDELEDNKIQIRNNGQNVKQPERNEACKWVRRIMAPISATEFQTNAFFPSSRAVGCSSSWKKVVLLEKSPRLRKKGYKFWSLNALFLVVKETIVELFHFLDL